MNYCGISSVDAQRSFTDEQMIKNMITILNSPNIVQIFNDDELSQIYQVVKNHINIKASNALREQQTYITLEERRRSMNR